MIEEDFEKKPFIYFDWNEIQNLKVRIHRKYAETLSKISKLKSNFIFPLSEAHLLDLKKSNNHREIKNDLDFLNYNFSDGYILCYIKELDQYKILSFDKIRKEEPYVCDVYRYYYEVSKDDNYKDINKSIRIPEFPVALSKMSDINPLKSHLESNNGIMNSSVLENLLNELVNNINNPEYINNFNNAIRNISYSSESAFQAFSNKEEIQSFFDDLIQYTRLIFDELSKNKSLFENLLLRLYGNMDNSRKIYIAYHFLNLNMVRNGVGENFNKNNFFSNYNTDANHVISAVNSSYFLTRDKNMIKKIKILNKFNYTDLNLKNLDELLNESI